MVGFSGEQKWFKITGMPVWGKTHSDEKIWALVAFMKKLPTMSSDEYEKMNPDMYKKI